MCGFFGVVNTDVNNKVDLSRAKLAIGAISHRGPDFQGVTLIKDNIAFSHARLSIIDIREIANQPFTHKHYTLIFNGEIFNYLELKEELIALGHSFQTESDTEVVLSAYDEWQEDCVNHFNGMWAFAIYDAHKDHLFCSRDRFGIKPFVYCINDKQFLFGSEIKSLLSYDPSLKKPNYRAIASYLKESTGAEAKETWFTNVFRLDPGHNLFIKNGEIKKIRYWDYPKEEKQFDKENYVQKFYNLFKDAVQIRLRSDVPLGATLSSGLDSSTIAEVTAKQITQPLKCYTASFPNYPLDEFKEAAVFVKGRNIEHIPVHSEYKDFVSVLKQLIYHLESGHSSPAIFPLYNINKQSSKDITVFLEGQGADELMGGYIEKNIIVVLIEHLIRFRFLLLWKDFNLFKNRYSIKEALVLYLRSANIPIINRLLRIFYGYEHLYGEKIKHESLFKLSSNAKRLYRLRDYLVDQHQRGLVNLLHYGDAIAMMFSLENRVPYMDYRLVEYVFKLPYTTKVQSGYGKQIQRLAFTGYLDDSLILNYKKKGFPSPITEMFKAEGSKKIFPILNSSKFTSRQLVTQKSLDELISSHISGKKDNSRILFRILSVELWFQEFIDKKSK